MTTPLYKPFTKAEQRIVALMLEGKGPTAMAEALGLARNTVYFHLSGIETKVPGHQPIRIRLHLWAAGLPPDRC